MDIPLVRYCHNGVFYGFKLIYLTSCITWKDLE